jgi:hypothetical protein
MEQWKLTVLMFIKHMRIPAEFLIGVTLVSVQVIKRFWERQSITTYNTLFQAAPLPTE